jgi:hypothetical protein
MFLKTNSRLADKQMTLNSISIFLGPFPQRNVVSKPRIALSGLAMMAAFVIGALFQTGESLFWPVIIDDALVYNLTCSRSDNSAVLATKGI